MIRATGYLERGAAECAASGWVTLAHDERHLRRKLLLLQGGESVLVDLPEATAFRNGDRLVLLDGRQIEVRASDEDLYEVRARDLLHLSELAWHLGNRHLPAQIEPERILIHRDHVIRAMLEGLGAEVRETVEPFQPLRGAYHSHHPESPGKKKEHHHHLTGGHADHHG
jgi:urease accessory protein